MLTRRDWWLGVLLLAAALLAHAAFPRYQWQKVPDTMRFYVRFDRWTGEVAVRQYDVSAYPPSSAATAH